MPARSFTLQSPNISCSSILFSFLILSGSMGKRDGLQVTRWYCGSDTGFVWALFGLQVLLVDVDEDLTLWSHSLHWLGQKLVKYS